MFIEIFFWLNLFPPPPATAQCWERQTCSVSSPDQLPKSATLPKWAMLFLIRQSQIQNNPTIHCFNWNNLLFVCCFWASKWLKLIMFWMYLDYWIYVTIILKQNNMFCFLNKKIWKTVKFEFQIFILTTRSILFSHGQNILKDMDNKWCEGKHFPTINKVYTKEKPLRLLNSEGFSKFLLSN